MRGPGPAVRRFASGIPWNIAAKKNKKVEPDAPPRCNTTVETRVKWPRGSPTKDRTMQATPVPDEQLLDLFVNRSDPGAFRALVARHGPMVLRVCRSVLRDPHDAEDAFQATFLVLVRRAGSLWARDSLGPWLHQVAHRTASRARSVAARRRRHEARGAELMARSTHEDGRDDLGGVVHEEVGRLPERYRAAVVLCLLEGLTPEQAARYLRCPVGTVQSRLARGREQLRGRLTRRGLTVPAGLLAVGGARSGASAAVPAALANSTIRAA